MKMLLNYVSSILSSSKIVEDCYYCYCFLLLMKKNSALLLVMKSLWKVLKLLLLIAVDFDCYCSHRYFYYLEKKMMY